MAAKALQIGAPLLLCSAVISTLSEYNHEKLWSSSQMMFPAALPAFDDVFEFLVSSPSPRQILAYEPPQHLQERLTQLLSRNREGVLSLEEQTELDQYLILDRFFGKLKLHACKKLMKSCLYPRTT